MAFVTPEGICRCGCGQKTALAERSRKTILKGQPQKFILGHNTRQTIVQGEKECGGCRKCLPLENFGRHSRTASGYRSYCRTCRKEEAVRYRANQSPLQLKHERTLRESRVRERQSYILDILKAYPCADCQETDIRVLEFDHVRGVKQGNISTLVRSASFERLKQEIAKCEVVCRNCHTRREIDRRGFWRGKV